MLRFKFKNFSSVDLEAKGALAISVGSILVLFAILLLATTGLLAFAVWKIVPLFFA